MGPEISGKQQEDWAWAEWETLGGGPLARTGAEQETSGRRPGGQASRTVPEGVRKVRNKGRTAPEVEQENESEGWTTLLKQTKTGSLMSPKVKAGSPWRPSRRVTVGPFRRSSRRSSS